MIEQQIVIKLVKYLSIMFHRWNGGAKSLVTPGSGTGKTDRSARAKVAAMEDADLPARAQGGGDVWISNRERLDQLGTGKLRIFQSFEGMGWIKTMQNQGF